jgi:hypothetical protein
MSMRPCALSTARFRWTVRASVDGSHRPAAPYCRGDRPLCHRRCGVDRSVAGSPGRSLLVDEDLPPAVRGGSGRPFGGRLARRREDDARGAIIEPDMARLRRPTPLALRLQLRDHLLQGNAVRGRGLTGGRQGVLQVIVCLYCFEQAQLRDGDQGGNAAPVLREEHTFTVLAGAPEQLGQSSWGGGDRDFCHERILRSQLRNMPHCTMGMTHRQEEDVGGVWRRDGRLHTVVCPPAADIDTWRSGGGGAGHGAN